MPAHQCNPKQMVVAAVRAKAALNQAYIAGVKAGMDAVKTKDRDVVHLIVENHKRIEESFNTEDYE